MKHFKDLNNKVHAIEEEFKHLLPAGCVEITVEEASELAIQNAPKPDPKVEAKYYLTSTDWYVTRKMETKKAIPKGIAEKREAARQILSGESE